MSARILIVDDLVPNLNLLELKLTAEYYDVVRATSGYEALKIADREPIDLVLLDAMMPRMNGFETCAKLKSDPKTWHIPVVMVTALEETKDRVRGLEAGADDFITKPIDDFNLMARVRSLLRLKMLTDQLLSHTGHNLADSRPMLDKLKQRRGKIMIIDDLDVSRQRVIKQLKDDHDVSFYTDPKTALTNTSESTDLIIVSLTSAKFDGHRLCARLRSDGRTKDTPIVGIGDASDEPGLIRAYDIGVNDTVMRPIEPQEMLARVSTQLKRKFYADSLRDDFQENLEMVITDPLTGLGNRRFFDRGLMPLLESCAAGTAFSLIMFDVDHFKRVNDILGHDTGDDVLKEVAARLASNLRAVDLISRYGGEEFVVAMPDTSAQDAMAAADRIRALISGTPIHIDGASLYVSVSAGIAQAAPHEKPRDIMRRADEALYRAKRAGRDQVMQAEATLAA